MTTSLRPLVVIGGPTASGKTSLAITLAERFRGEIISCDSVSVYKELEIGTAKPSPEQRARVPHHLLDVVAPDQFFTAGEFSRMAREAAREISDRGRLPIVSGGTGLYLRAMLEGLFAGPERSEELRARLRERAQKKPESLWRLLRRFDAKAAERIHPNDHSKLIRALEICLAARKPVTELWQQGRDPLAGYRILRIGLNPDRERLYARINQRCAEMFEEGLLDETKRLLERYTPDLFALRSLGYRQAVEYLRGECDLASAISAAQQGHRNYAKRQLTWFRREPEMHWIAGFGTEEHAITQSESLVATFLEPEASSRTE